MTTSQRQRPDTGRRVPILVRIPFTLILAASIAGWVVTGCSQPSSPPSASHSPTTTAASSPPASSGMPGMPGMSEPMPGGDGLSASQSGFTLVPATTTVPANTANTFTFRITGPTDAPVTQFVTEQTKLLHLYLIRSDLTGFAHLHPTMAADGTWSTALPPMTPGNWRAYAQFTAQQPNDVTTALVLSTALTVPGAATTAPLPAPSSTATADGYTITLSGQAAAGRDTPMTLAFSRDGQPVTDLEPYLDTYAHVTAIQSGTLAFAHLHPSNPVSGDHGGPTLTIQSAFPNPGDWALFIEFQTAGTVHTASTTIHVA